MQRITDNNDAAARQIEKLERELEEMTAALTLAWDQLVPFLQAAPAAVETTRDIEPILHALAAAADVELAGALLFAADEWFSVPVPVALSAESVQQVCGITQERAVSLTTESGQTQHWACAPISSEQAIIGVLGVGTRNLQRAFSAVELRIVSRMAERVGSQLAVAQLARIREREALLAREMQIANEIQQSIQPREAPCAAYLDMAAYWKPAKEVGGDAWGWVQQPDGRLAWFILDVAGKGLPAALAAVSLHTAISMALRMRLPPAEVLREVNAAVYDAYTRTDLMATAAIVALDPQTGALEIANAGHPPLLVRQQNSWGQLPATVPPIGVLPDLRAQTQRLVLQTGDLLLGYSDGFTEIRTGSGLWGQEGLLAAIPAETQDVRRLADVLVAAAQQAGQIQDDQTLVAALYRGG